MKKQPKAANLCLLLSVALISSGISSTAAAVFILDAQRVALNDYFYRVRGEEEGLLDLRLATGAAKAMSLAYSEKYAYTKGLLLVAFGLISGALWVYFRRCQEDKENMPD